MAVLAQFLRTIDRAGGRDGHRPHRSCDTAAMRNLRAFAPAALAGALFGLLGTVVIAADDETGGALRGDVGDRDGVTKGAEVAAGPLGWNPDFGEHVATTTTDELGKFSLEGAPLGPIDVWVRPKDGKWKFSIRMMHPGVNDLEVNATPVREYPDDFGGFGDDKGEPRTGVVLDNKGKPLAGAAVGASGSGLAWTVTDADGKFAFEKLANGDRLLVRARGFKDKIVELKKKKKVKVKLGVPKPTTVLVVNKAKEPVAGAWVTLGDEDRMLGTEGFSQFPPADRLVGGWTNAAGEVQILWPGKNTKSLATAYAHGFAPTRGKFTAAKRTTLTLEPAKPVRAIAVVKESGYTLNDVFVGALHKSSGGVDTISAVPQADQRGPIVLGRTDQNGQCVIPALPLDSKMLCVVGEQRRHANVTTEPVGAVE